MSYSSTVASEQLDYGFLLLTHIVCADQQIHSQESKYLKELGDLAERGTCVIAFSSLHQKLNISFFNQPLSNFY